MAGVIFVRRIARLPLVDVSGAPIGRIDDLVVAPPVAPGRPRVVGFVASVQRRRIFLNGGRVGELDTAGVRLRSGVIDLRPFQKRRGEILAVGDLVDTKLGPERVRDVGVQASPDRPGAWEVVSLAIGGTGLLRRRADRVVDWREGRQLFEAGPVAGEVSALREMRAADAAAALAAHPIEHRRELARAMEDESLADLLEELPEGEQIVILEGLDLERIAQVLEEMSPDDAADVLAEMPPERVSQILSAMAPEEAGPLRRLLVYDAGTAGGLMTPEPLILPPTATVAEALARIRQPGVPSAIAAQVFVTEPPTDTPTGRYLGSVGFQRLLGAPPSLALKGCLDDEPPAIGPDLSETSVAARLATYNLLAVPVCDKLGRLVGAVTVDDVLDRVLPAKWRQP